MHNDYPLSPLNTHNQWRAARKFQLAHDWLVTGVALKCGDCTISPSSLSFRQHPVSLMLMLLQRSVFSRFRKSFINILLLLLLLLNIPDWIKHWSQYALLRGTERRTCTYWAVPMDREQFSKLINTNKSIFTQLQIESQSSADLEILTLISLTELAGFPSGLCSVRGWRVPAHLQDRTKA